MKQLFRSLFCFFIIVSSLTLHADTPLEGKMSKMKGTFKELSKSLQAPVEADKAKYVQLATQLRDLMKESRELTPEKTDEIPAEKRAEFVQGYQKQIDQSIALLETMIQTLEASNWPEAQKQFDLLKQYQKEGHKAYRAEHP
ncbi:MAG: cytochrome b562 [Verrucomicrobiota bacterium]